MELYVEYWLEVVESTFEEHGIEASSKQIQAIAADISISAESLSLVFWTPHESPIHNQLKEENTRLKTQLERYEHSKRCEGCEGRGYHIDVLGGKHTCDMCEGMGRIALFGS